MFSDFTFRLSDIRYQIREGGAYWVVPCKPQFTDSNQDSFPLRGDVTFLNGTSCELTIKEYQDGALDTLFITNGIDTQIEEWRAANYPCLDDAYIMRYFPQTADMEQFIGIMAALRSPKYQSVHTFLHQHIGRPDLIGRLVCPFHGYREQYFENPTIPSRNEFLSGRHYFTTGEQSLTFSSSLP